MNKRRQLLVEPRFQVQFTLRMAGWVTLATCITAAITLAFLAAADRRMAGDFFFIMQEAGTHPVLLNRTEIILPALAVSLAVNLVLSAAFALLYSQRLAGPVYRLSQDMLKLSRGEHPKLPYQLRESDELQEVAHAFDALLKSLEHKK